MSAHNGEPIPRTVGDNGSQFRYLLFRTDTRRLSVSVHPDLTISATAPRDAPINHVDMRVLARGPWIHRQLQRFDLLHPLPTPRRYIGGETHLYLGRQYRLRLRKGQEEVRLESGRLILTTPSRRSPHHVQRVLNDWYRARATQVFQRRLTSLVRRLPWLRRGDIRLRVRGMTTRWGSCGPEGVITLNVELVKAPVSCIDYVLVHELCHRLELRHSRRFYALLRSAVPEWERARERLNSVIR